MPETLAPPAVAVPTHQGLLSRAMGVIVSPRATYADLRSRPRVLGALLLILGCIVAGSLVFFNTTVGQDALLDQQIQTLESFRGPVTDEVYSSLEQQAPYLAYFTAAGQLVSLPIMMLVTAGLAYLIFNAILGGEGTFKQVFAVVVHSGFVLVLAQAFVLPLDYVRESISSPTTLLVFLPFLDENTFVARFLAVFDLFYLWWVVNLAIGLGVLFKRRTGPIVTGLFAVYVTIALIVAAIRSAFSGV